MNKKNVLCEEKEGICLQIWFQMIFGQDESLVVRLPLDELNTKLGSVLFQVNWAAILSRYVNLECSLKDEV